MTHYGRQGSLSGIEVPKDIIDQFEELKNKKHRYQIIKLNEDGTNFVSKIGNRAADFDLFKKEFTSDECAFGIFDSEEAGKCFWVHYNPDGATVKNKLACAAGANAIENAFGYHHILQATNLDELSDVCS